MKNLFMLPQTIQCVSWRNAWLCCSDFLLPCPLINQPQYINTDFQTEGGIKKSIGSKLKLTVCPSVLHNCFYTLWFWPLVAIFGCHKRLLSTDVMQSFTHILQDIRNDKPIAMFTFLVFFFTNCFPVKPLEDSIHCLLALLITSLWSHFLD